MLRAAPADPVPVVEGDILDDPAWQGVEGVDAFWQESPNEGAPASEQTNVRIVFTNDTLYVGVICYDRELSGIIVADSRRDTPLDDTGSFHIIFDTYRDGLNGFVFGTTPRGWSTTAR